MRFRGTFVLAALVLAVSVPTASAQIISTSIPSEAAPGAAEKNWAFHVMAGYAAWDFAYIKALEKGDPGDQYSLDFTRPQGFILAGDFVYEANDRIAVGAGGWYNAAGFSGDFIWNPTNERSDFSQSDVKMWSLYGNVFYKAIGAQIGVVGNKNTLDFPASGDIAAESYDFTSTDMTYFLVGRFGGERFALGAGLGAYKYGTFSVNGTKASEAGDWVPSGYVNASVKVVKGLSVDAGVWYIGESSAKDDSATRFTVGAGYSF